MRLLPLRPASRHGTARRRRIVPALVLALTGSVALTGCDFSVYSLPLPGGADVGDDPMTLTAEFTDVLDLVPQSAVKVNDVSVGKITDIELDGYTAEVTMEVRDSVDLPANAVATIRQTSLLGEKFVDLAPPDQGANQARLSDNDTIPLSRSGDNPEVEEVLGALSLLLNGGGLPQVRTIARELNTALGGREPQVRSALNQINKFVSRLDNNKAAIVTSIEKLNDLSVGVRQQQGSIDNALEELPSALKSLDRQRDDLVLVLQSLADLGEVGTRVINRTKQGTIETLRQLQPLLTQLGNAGDALIDSINVSLTFPFVDDVVGRDPQVARNLRPGDYTNLDAKIQIDLSNLPGLPCTTIDDALADTPLADLADTLDVASLCQGLQAPVQNCISALANADPTALDPNATLGECLSGLIEGLPDVLSSVCSALPAGLPVPVICSDPDDGGILGGGLPGDLGTGTGTDDGGGGLGPVTGDDGLLGGLTGGSGGSQNGTQNGNGQNGGGQNGGGNGSGGSGGSGGASGGGGLGGLLGLNSSQPGLLNRPAVGSGRTASTSREMTMGQLMQTFDPALVSLLTPTLVTR